jgi:hypothetical protein
MQDRKAAVGVGLATMGLVYYTYDQALPPLTDVRTADRNDRNGLAAEKAARWTGAGLVALMTFITRDATVFIMGGSSVILMSWLHRHALMVDPTIAGISLPSSRTSVHAGDGTPAGSGM